MPARAARGNHLASVSALPPRSRPNGLRPRELRALGAPDEESTSVSDGASRRYALRVCACCSGQP
eukprot:711010-Alexandrium_andersonii.AAC.1